jgi:hypothetical protein
LIKTSVFEKKVNFSPKLAKIAENNDIDPRSHSYTFEFTTTTTMREIIFILKTRYAISCVVNFYNAGVVTRDRRIGSRTVFLCANKNRFVGH